MENNNYNINFDPKKLSSEEINQHKSFDDLMNQFETNPPAPKQATFKTLYYIAGALAAALVGVLLFFNWAGNSNAIDQVSTSQYLASQPYINPPIEGVEKAFGQGQIDAYNGGIYEYDNGTKVIVPGSAFVDDNGNTVTGAVDIKYREYHDFIDFFVSGIPMEYDSAGTKYNLESAGMMEIYAEQDGKRLSIAPGKDINVEMVSEIMVPANDRANIPKFNIYQLDEKKRNWVYEGRDQIEVLEEDITNLLAMDDDSLSGPDVEYLTVLNQIETDQITQINKIEASVPKPFQPLKPVRENGSDYVFNLDFAEEDIIYSSRSNPTETEKELDRTQDQLNELRRQYANTLWQVSNKTVDFNQELVEQINWEDAKMEQINNRDYRLTLINPDKIIEVIVNPVLSATDYNSALENFNQQMATFNQQLAERNTQLAEQKRMLAEKIKEEKELAKKSYEEKLAFYQDKGNETAATNLMITNRVLNKFTVNNFGIWNCDRPLPPFIYNIKGDFVESKSKKQFKHNTVYLVDRNKNTVCRFYASEKADVLFDNRSENIMWMVTEENKIATYRPEQFKEITDQRGEHTFVMDLSENPISSEAELREILTF